MKKIFFIILVLFTIVSFSQNNYMFKNGGGVEVNGQKIAQNKVRELFKSNTKALELYNTGRTKKTAGNLFIYGGLGIIVLKTFNTLNNPTRGNGNITPNSTAYVVGGIMIAFAMPIKIGFSNKIKKAILLMNEDAKNPKITFIESSELIANSNGIGLSLKF